MIQQAAVKVVRKLTTKAVAAKEKDVAIAKKNSTVKKKNSFAVKSLTRSSKAIKKL